MKKMFLFLFFVLLISGCGTVPVDVEETPMPTAAVTLVPTLITTPTMTFTPAPSTQTPFVPTALPEFQFDDDITVIPVAMGGEFVGTLPQNLIFSAKEDGDWNLFVLEKDLQVKRITEGMGSVFTAKWSPDGEKVIVELYDRELEQSTYWLLDKNGEILKQLFLNQYGQIVEISWAPDSKRFVFSSVEKIYVGDIETDLFSVIFQGKSIYYLEWSPVDETIAFTQGITSLESHVYAIESNGNNFRQLTDIDAIENTLVWSPGGEKIAFKRQIVSEGGWDIVVINKDGTDERKIAEIDVASQILWSPDGKEIGYFYTFWFGHYERSIYPCVVSVESLDFVCYGIETQSISGWTKDGAYFLISDNTAFGVWHSWLIDLDSKIAYLIIDEEDTTGLHWLNQP